MKTNQANFALTYLILTALAIFVAYLLFGTQNGMCAALSVFFVALLQDSSLHCEVLENKIRRLEQKPVHTYTIPPILFHSSVLNLGLIVLAFMVPVPERIVILVTVTSWLITTAVMYCLRWRCYYRTMLPTEV